MGNLKEIRNRISSVKSTQQITRAMKMVSASKLRRAQDAILRMRPYVLKLNEVMMELSEGIEDLSENPYYQDRQVEKILLIPITSDKGLCGSFNSNVIRETEKIIKSYPSIGKKKFKIDLICLGKKGWDHFRKRGYNVVGNYTDLSKNIKYTEVEQIADKVLAQFAHKDYDLILFIYNSFKNAAVYKTTPQQFLPLILEEFERPRTTEKQYKPNFIFEPSDFGIFTQLIPRSLKLNFYRVILESNAAEHGARMTAMNNATENAEELVGELRLTYNKERQATITREIIEIVSGAQGV
jgi:F-type H+-transporting ATPase subunit gamma